MLKVFLMLGADVNTVDNHGSTPLHVITLCLANSAYEWRFSDVESGEEDTGVIRDTKALDLSQGDWIYLPPCFSTQDPYLTKKNIRLLVSQGGNIYAKNSMGCTPMSLVRDKYLKADVLFLTRRSLLLFFEAVCIADDLACYDSFQRVCSGEC